MLVKSVTFNRAGGVSRFTAEFSKAASPERTFTGQIAFHADVEPPETPGDPFLAAALLPAMFLGESLEVSAPVSGRLVKAITTVQDIYLSWYPGFLKRIAVMTPFVVPEGTPRFSDATACFFSGGMDSRYSLVKHRQTISTLLTVKGFDIPASDESVWPQIVAANRETAAAFGMKLIPVETDLRDVLDPTYPGLGRSFDGDFWGRCLHGPFLAAVGLGLQRHFGTVIIPSTWPYERLQPWGSHPLADPQWTTAATTFLHDGCELGRLGKLKVVSQTTGALRHLRTCSVYTAGCYNCGKCDKCYRTNLMLQLFKVFEQAGSYGAPVPLHSLITWQMPPHLGLLYRDLMEEASAQGHEEMADLLRVTVGDRISLGREWHRLKRSSAHLGAMAFTKLGFQRHARSIRKRWNRLRGVTN